MKALIVMMVALGLAASGMAGGLSSQAVIDEVREIVVEDGKVTIKGDGMISMRRMTSEEHGDSRVFGQPTQMVHARVRDGVFEIIPYFGRDEIKGVPTGGHSQEELKALSDRQWEGLLKLAATIKVGDAITINYQRDRMVSTNFQVREVTGSGSVEVRPRQQPEAAKSARGD